MLEVSLKRQVYSREQVKVFGVWLYFFFFIRVQLGFLCFGDFFLLQSCQRLNAVVLEDMGY